MPLTAAAWGDKHRSALAAATREQVQRRGLWRTEVLGRSMEPTVPGGSIVEVTPLPTVLELGELLAFVPDTAVAMVVHRVIATQIDGSVLTHGDGSTLEDGWSKPERHIGVVRRYWLGGRAYSAIPGQPPARPSKLRRQLQRAARALRRLGVLRF